MLGLDKKSLRKLERMLRLPDGQLSEAHQRILSSMDEWYKNPQFKFFTSSQRRMIDDVATIYLEPPTRKELLFLESMDLATTDEYANDREKEIGLSILGRNGRNIKAFTKKELKFFREMLDRLKERRRQKEVRDRLEAALDAGEVRLGSENFCGSIIRQFDERKQWSPIQMEHAEKILAGNEDPEDEED
jgi:hypothetical protein